MTDRTDEVLTKVIDAYVAATPMPPELPEVRTPGIGMSRPALAFAGGFGVVVLIGIALAVVTYFASESNPATAVSEDPAEAASPSGESLFSELEWSIAVDDQGRDLAFNAMAADSERLVAVGQIGASAQMDTPNMATIWYSDDEGTSWIEIADSSFVPRAWQDGAIEPTSTIANMADVVRGPEGFVAVGQLDGDAAVWVSPDGIRWESVDEESFGGQGLQAMNNVVASNGALVATGYSDSGSPVWTSQDGRNWLQVDLFATFPWPTAIGHNSGFTVFAQNGDETGIWISPDGLSWEYRGNTDVELDLIAQNPDDGSFLAIGSGVWTSPDGVTWTLIHSYTEPGHANALDPTRPDSGTLIWHDDRLIASDPDTGIWSSTDAINWNRIDWGNGPEQAELVSINGNLIAIGGAIWIGTPGQI